MRRLLLAAALAGAARSKTHHGEDLAAWVRSSSKTAAGPAAVEVARQRIKDALAELVAYYDGDERLLDALAASTPGFAHNLEAKLAALAVGTHTSKRFVVAALGSSVTAGHDGFGATAYPAVLERRLRRALEPLGIEVEVRNQAVGGAEPFPRSLCLSPIAGDDADLVVREWEYWEFSDGLQVGMNGGPEGAVEMFARHALNLPAAPAVLFLQMDAGGASGKSRQLKNLLDPGGRLGKAYGADHALGLLSAFGAAFDHLRAAAPKARTHRNGKDPCKGANIGDCPLGPKPDGHHKRPLYLGVPEDSPLKPHADPAKLYINWHPGTLGHEVMGHQIAYAVLSAAQRGLTALANSGSTASQFKKKPLPAAVGCAGSPFCKGFARCAVSSWPKAQGPDVGDWVDNSTSTNWVNAPTSEGASVLAACAENAPATGHGGKAHCLRDPASMNCYSHHRKCSYADMKRAFVGGPSSGPLVLKVPPGACSLYLSEPGFSWVKPVDVANWHAELTVTVDGEPCRACRVAQARGAYLQNLVVDVAAHRGGKPAEGGDCGGAKVAISVTPIESLAAWEASSGKKVCDVARNGRCEPAGDWRRNKIDCQPDGDPPKGARHTSCHIKPGTAALKRDPSRVSAYVTGVLAW